MIRHKRRRRRRTRLLRRNTRRAIRARATSIIREQRRISLGVVGDDLSGLAPAEGVHVEDGVEENRDVDDGAAGDVDGHAGPELEAFEPGVKEPEGDAEVVPDGDEHDGDEAHDDPWLNICGAVSRLCD